MLIVGSCYLSTEDEQKRKWSGNDTRRSGHNKPPGEWDLLLRRQGGFQPAVKLLLVGGNPAIDMALNIRF